MTEKQPLPDVKTDSFEAAGLPPKGPGKVTLKEWEYQPPKKGTTNSGAYRGTFTLTEKPGKPGLDIRCSESFFIDPTSLWKLRDMAMAMGVNHGTQAVNWKDVAMECVDKSCWVYIDHQKGNDGRIYARFTSFAPNLAKLTEGTSAAAESVGGVRL